MFPDFESSILIVSKWPYVPKVIDELIGKYFQTTDLRIETRSQENDDDQKTQFVSVSSIINIYFSDAFFSSHYNRNSNDLQLFYEHFHELVKPLVRTADEIVKENSEHRKEQLSYSTLSAFYRTKDPYILHFLFGRFTSQTLYSSALKDMFELITKCSSGDKELGLSLEKTHSQHNQIKYFSYFSEHWKLLDPLLEFTRSINDRYKVKADARIKKPFVILHESDYRKYFVLDTNWVLRFDDLQTLMIRPNDVSLYASLCEKALGQAREFYRSTIVPRFEHNYGSFPSIEKQSEYFNYFELIISALVFSYTALEAFANICIPNSFEHRFEAGGKTKTHSKEKIERTYPLWRKFQEILPLIIKCPDPANESWWKHFKSMEDLRNETIHTKQSKSEQRYSKLLTKDIFEMVECYRGAITFFGRYIVKNHKELLEEYPYEFGYDEFWPHLTIDDEYKKMYKDFHNTDDLRKA